jgi:hypothetical protein
MKTKIAWMCVILLVLVGSFASAEGLGSYGIMDYNGQKFTAVFVPRGTEGPTSQVDIDYDRYVYMSSDGGVGPVIKVSSDSTFSVSWSGTTYAPAATVEEAWSGTLATMNDAYKKNTGGAEPTTPFVEFTGAPAAPEPVVSKPTVPDTTPSEPVVAAPADSGAAISNVVPATTQTQLISPLSDLGGINPFNTGANAFNLQSAVGNGPAAGGNGATDVADGNGPASDGTPAVSGPLNTGSNAFADLLNNLDQLKPAQAEKLGEPAVQTAPAQTPAAETPETQTPATPTAPAKKSITLKSALSDIYNNASAAAYGFNWALKGLFPKFYENMTIALGTTFKLPDTAANLFCTLTREFTPSQNMVGAKQEQMPSMQLQAWRSDEINYPIYGGKEAGVSEVVPILDTLYYTKVTFRFENIIDPLVTILDSPTLNIHKSYKINLTGYDYTGKAWTFDLAPGNDSFLLELSTGSASVGGANAVMGYWKVPIDKVCLIFIDDQFIIDPMFKKKLQDAGNGRDRFCTDVVVVTSKDTEGVLVYDAPEGPSPASGNALTR